MIVSFLAGVAVSIFFAVPITAMICTAKQFDRQQQQRWAFLYIITSKCLRFGDKTDYEKYRAELEAVSAEMK